MSRLLLAIIALVLVAILAATCGIAYMVWNSASDQKAARDRDDREAAKSLYDRYRKIVADFDFLRGEIGNAKDAAELERRRHDIDYVAEEWVRLDEKIIKSFRGRMQRATEQIQIQSLTNYRFRLTIGLPLHPHPQIDFLINLLP